MCLCVLLPSLFVSVSFDLGPKVEATFHFSSTITIWQIGFYYYIVRRRFSSWYQLRTKKKKTKIVICSLVQVLLEYRSRPAEKCINLSNCTSPFPICNILFCGKNNYLEKYRIYFTKSRTKILLDNFNGTRNKIRLSMSTLFQKKLIYIYRLGYVNILNLL